MFKLLKRNIGLFLVVLLMACSATTPESPLSPPENRPHQPPVTGGPPLERILPNPVVPSPALPPRLNYVAQGLASWYPAFAHGTKTASGEVYDLYGMTAAHATLPLLSWVSVRNLETGETVIVKINDRLVGQNTLVQLSYEAAQRLNLFNRTPYVEVIGIAPPRSRLSEQEGLQTASYKPTHQ